MIDTWLAASASMRISPLPTAARPISSMHADPATRAVPVVVVGSGASASLCQRLIARGAQSYLPMPFHAADLCRVLDYALSAPSRAAA